MGTHQDRRIFYVLKMGIFGWSVGAALCRPFYKSDLVYIGENVYFHWLPKSIDFDE